LRQPIFALQARCDERSQLLLLLLPLPTLLDAETSPKATNQLILQVVAAP
jgi:hypothetical protein